MTQPRPAQPFHMIKKRTGGTFTFSPSPLPPHDLAYLGPDLIGTYGCTNAVAFYFKISPTQCFFAHMPVAVRMAHPEDTEEPDTRSVSAEEGAKVKAQVLVRLQEEAEQHGWFPPAFEREVVVCCPVVQEDRGKHRFAMHYVVEGIKAFLGRGDLRVEDVEGFVVDQRKGCVVLDGWFEVREDGKVGREPEGVERGVFRPVEARGKNARGWGFEVDREEILEPLGVGKRVEKGGAGRLA